MANRQRWCGLFLGLTVLGGTATAQDRIVQTGGIGRSGCATPIVVAPGGCACPAVPQATTPGEATPPTTVPSPDTTPNLQLGSELQGTGESASVALASPNMFGDAFGTRGFRAYFSLPVGGTLLPRVPTDPFTGTASPIAQNKIYGPGGVTFTNVNGFTVGGLTFPALAFTNSGAITFPLASGSVALTNQPALEQALLAQAQRQFGPGVTLVAGPTTATLVPPGTVTITQNSPASKMLSITQSPFSLSAQYTAEGQLLIPAATGGGVVGRTTISDDNSPLPRDRVIFDYDLFNNVPLSTRGVDVNRFSVGIEKTFFDGQMSLEVRLPFAATLSDDVHSDGSTSSDQAELGDLNLTLKALVYRSTTIAVASGLGIALPTGDNLTVVDSFGTVLLHVKNESVVLTPYLAYLLTPTDRLFFQNWVEFGFDTNGNPVSANLDLTGLQNVGRLRDQTLCQIDAQLGYWLIRPEESSSLLRGLAPFVELHYNATLGNPSQLETPSFALVADDAHVDELNLTAGFLSVLGDHCQLGVGVVVPLKGNNDRTFDWQIGIHGNYFFGPSAGDTSRYARATNF